MRILLVCILFFAAVGNAHANKCRDHKLNQNEAQGAAAILLKAGEYLKPNGLVAPTLIRVTSAVASEDKSTHNAGKGVWELKVNGASLGQLTNVYVPAISGPPGTFTALWGQLGCAKAPKFDYRKGPADPKDPLPFALAIAKVEASSTLLGSRLFAGAIMDGNNSSGWCEGKRGPGLGESVTVHFANSQPVSTLRIAAAPKGFNSPTAIRVSVNGGKLSQDIVVKVGEPIALPRTEIKSLTIRIAKAPNKGLARTCIGELRVSDGDKQYALIRGVDAAGVAALPTDLSNLFDAIRSCDAAAMATYVNFPLHTSYYDSDDGGHYEQGSKLWRSAKSLAASCKRTPSGYYPARRLKDAKAPYFAASDLYAAGEVVGAIVLYLSTPGSEYWRIAWNGSKWRLEATSDMPDSLCDACD